MKAHCDPNRRHDFVFLFDVVNGNPNGDPDAGNLPRFDPETMHGIVTDVCIKRKIRDYVASVLGRPIFIQSETALNDLIRTASKGAGVAEPAEVTIDEKLVDGEENTLEDHLSQLGDDWEYDPEARKLSYEGDLKSPKDFREALLADTQEPAALVTALKSIAGNLAKAAKNRKKLGPDSRKVVKNELCKKYFDTRMFGAVLTAGTNFGQVRGPMQLTFARSIDPIRPLDLSITRVAITKATDLARKSTEMGRKSVVPYALYRAHGFFNPLLGTLKDVEGKQEHLVTEKDLEEFWEALQNLFTFDRSASRGEMSVRGIYIFTHENKKGDAHAHKLFELIGVQPVGSIPRSFDDYKNTITAPKEGPLDEFPGVTLTALQ